MRWVLVGYIYRTGGGYEWCVHNSGRVEDYPFYDPFYGLRPVIALPSTTEVTKNGDIWVVSHTGTGYTNPGLRVTASGITAADYGAYVTNYAAADSAAQKSVNWRIFHTDGTNIYLIADNYIETQYWPAGKSGSSSSEETSGIYAATLKEAEDYAGTEDISSDLKAKWLSKYTTTSTDGKAKATAYLLDTGVWNPVFVNSSYADYAIGGPTIELFAASYNETHEIDIETQTTENIYQVKWSTDESYASEISGLNTNEDLYVISNSYDSTVIGMRLASPAAEDTPIDPLLSVFNVSCEGTIFGDFYNCNNFGLRPCVSLKSNIKIEKQGDGTYLIVE